MTKEFHYNVLEVVNRAGDTRYRILPDDSGLRGIGILVKSHNFEIVTNNIPSNWSDIKEYDNSISKSPQIWNTFDDWEESFWQDYENSLPKALQCFRDEVKKIIAADIPYIDIMIKERQNWNNLDNWPDTMIPLFNEVIKDYSKG